MKQLLVVIVALAFASPGSGQCTSAVLEPSDPYWVEHYGTSVGLSTDTLMVGVELDSEYSSAPGRVYVYEPAPAGWAETQVLYPHDSDPLGDWFGFDLSIYRDTVLISSLFEDCYIFERTPGGWVETTVLDRPPTAYGSFGHSVGLFGDTAAVGSQLSASTGSVFIFEKSGASWSQAQVLQGSGCSGPCHFGYDLSIHGDTLLVGAPRPGPAIGGRAHFFERQLGGWVEVQGVEASDAIVWDGFGIVVSLTRDVAVIGAPNHGNGAAYVFRRTAGRWVEEAKLAPTDLQTGAEFGSTVSVDWTPERGHSVLVTAPRDLVSGSYWSTAHLYKPSLTGWERVEVFPISARLVGGAADLLGQTLVVGAPWTGPYFVGEVHVLCGRAFTDPYCFCEQGPCGNDDALAGCASSTGTGAILEADGTTSVTGDDLILTASGLPTNQFGLIYMGGGRAASPFGDGLRCVTPGGIGVFRYPVQNSGPSGSINLGPGVVAYSHGLFGPAGRIAPGDTWNFQGWFRDPGGPCSNDFNLTNGMSVWFIP